MSYVIFEQQRRRSDCASHPRSLISALVVRCLDSIISLDSIAEISRLYLVSVAAQAGLCLAWSETPDDTFSHSPAHLYPSLSLWSICLSCICLFILHALRSVLFSLLFGVRGLLRLVIVAFFQLFN